MISKIPLIARALENLDALEEQDTNLELQLDDHKKKIHKICE